MAGSGVANAITGKSITFTFGTKDVSCQVESLDIEQKSDSDTVATLSCRAVISKGMEVTVSGSALYDGNTTATTGLGVGGFYKMAQDAITAGSAVAITIAGPDHDTWTSTAAVLTDLKVSIKADGAVEFDFDMSCADLTYTPGHAP